MLLTHIIGRKSDNEPADRTATPDRRQLGKYLLVGGTAVTVAALVGRRRWREDTEREMTTIEIRDTQAPLDR